MKVFIPTATEATIMSKRNHREKLWREAEKKEQAQVDKEFIRILNEKLKVISYRIKSSILYQHKTNIIYYFTNNPTELNLKVQNTIEKILIKKGYKCEKVSDTCLKITW